MSVCHAGWRLVSRGSVNMLEKSCWNCSLLSLDGFPGNCNWYPERKLIPVSIVDKGCKQFKLNSYSVDKRINELWNHAHAMADFTDSDKAPFEDRKVLVSAIFSIGKIIDKLKEVICLKTDIKLNI